jgi:hypothetical protein
MAYALKARTGRTPGSIVSGQVAQMLKDPNSARVAFILREILDRPVALRPRRAR